MQNLFPLKRRVSFFHLNVGFSHYSILDMTDAFKNPLGFLNMQQLAHMASSFKSLQPSMALADCYI